VRLRLTLRFLTISSSIDSLFHIGTLSPQAETFLNTSTSQMTLNCIVVYTFKETHLFETSVRKIFDRGIKLRESNCTRL